MSREVRGRGGIRAPRLRSAAALILVLPLPCGARQLRWEGGVSWATGRYVFTERTHTVVVSTGLAISWAERLDLSVSLPLVVQNSALVSAVGDLRLPTGGPDHGLVQRRRPGRPVPTRSGRGGAARSGLVAVLAAEDSAVVFADEFRARIGDPTAHLSVRLFGPRPGGAVRSVRLTAGLKAPLTSLEDGVGTGAWDGAVGLGVTVGVGRTLFSAATSWVEYGDLPELPLEGGLSGSLTLSRPVGDRFSVMASLTAAQSPIAGMEAPLGVGLGLGVAGRTGRILALSVVWGLSESTAGFGAGLGWSLPL